MFYLEVPVEFDAFTLLYRTGALGLFSIFHSTNGSATVITFDKSTNSNIATREGSRKFGCK